MQYQYSGNKSCISHENLNNNLAIMFKTAMLHINASYKQPQAKSSWIWTSKLLIAWLTSEPLGSQDHDLTLTRRHCWQDQIGFILFNQIEFDVNTFWQKNSLRKNKWNNSVLYCFPYDRPWPSKYQSLC